MLLWNDNLFENWILIPVNCDKLVKLEKGIQCNIYKLTSPNMQTLFGVGRVAW